MKKLIIFIISILPILSLAQELEITYDFPSKITVDEEMTVNVQIMKYDLNRFGKYQQLMPEGITVKNIEDASSEFSFENNVVTYLWSQLPEDSIIEISYKFTADSTLRGTFVTEGNFSYFYQNLRGTISTANTRVKVTNNYPVSTVKSSTVKKDTKTTTKEDVKTTTKEEVKTTETTANCDVTVLRNMKITNYKTVTVSLVISKCTYAGMAIIQEKIPENFTVITSKFDNCTYEQDLGYLEINISKMKAETSELTITYTLTSNENLTENPVITGKFKYLEKESLKSVTILDGTITGKLDTKKEVDTKVETKTEIIKEEPKTDNGEDDILKFLNEDN